MRVSEPRIFPFRAMVPPRNHRDHPYQGRPTAVQTCAYPVCASGPPVCGNTARVALYRLTLVVTPRESCVSERSAFACTAATATATTRRPRPLCLKLNVGRVCRVCYYFIFYCHFLIIFLPHPVFRTRFFRTFFAFFRQKWIHPIFAYAHVVIVERSYPYTGCSW